MGLIVSVLAICVGVYKVIQLYCDYVKKPYYVDRGICRTDATDDIRLQDRRPQLSREIFSHEDVEVVCSPKIFAPDAGSGSSSRRFLVTEKNDEFRDRSPSPRKFVVTKNDNEGSSDLREFLIAKSSPKNDPKTERFVLIDTKDEFRKVSPLPLPKKFVIKQSDLRLTTDALKSSQKGIGIEVTELSHKEVDLQNINVSNQNPSEKSLIRHFSESIICSEHIKISKSIVDSVKSIEAPALSISDIHNPNTEFHRDPSPYPSPCVSLRKGSISKELIDNDNVDMTEVNEDLYDAKTKVDVILQSSNFNTTEYWTNKILVTPPKKMKSQGHSSKCSDKTKSLLNVASEPSRSKSASRDPELKPTEELRRVNSTSKIYEKDYQEASTLFIDVLNKGYDENFRNSLDGIKKCSESRRSFKKRKNRSQNSLENLNIQNDNGEREVQSRFDDNSMLIFSGEYTKAMNKDWHGQHFCCWQCDESLTGQRYVLRDDHPYCVACYESVFANACEKCSRTIGIDSKDLSYKDKHWHEACFLCTTCGESLVDKQFGSKGDRIYCGRCYDNQFASRCDGCNEIFRAGTKKMEYKTRQWHEKCFCCCVCKVPIGTQSFIPREQEIYCAKCYEEKFATRCIKCNKVITSGGVTYKNEPWHRECFTCTNCSKSLAGERFTSRDEKPYCADCFGELFAKRCFACNKPITGIGGTKFISFEDRHWHNDCFFCAVCRSSLVGRGFITDQDDIICPECAKQKLL